MAVSHSPVGPDPTVVWTSHRGGGKGRWGAEKEASSTADSCEGHRAWPPATAAPHLLRGPQLLERGQDRPLCSTRLLRLHVGEVVLLSGRLQVEHTHGLICKMEPRSISTAPTPRNTGLHPSVALWELTMEVQVGADGLPVALPVAVQAPVRWGHHLLQALDPIANVAPLALAAPLVLQHTRCWPSCKQQLLSCAPVSPEHCHSCAESQQNVWPPWAGGPCSKPAAREPP